MSRGAKKLRAATPRQAPASTTAAPRAHALRHVRRAPARASGSITGPTSVASIAGIADDEFIHRARSISITDRRCHPAGQQPQRRAALPCAHERRSDTSSRPARAARSSRRSSRSGRRSRRSAARWRHCARQRAVDGRARSPSTLSTRRRPRQDRPNATSPNSRPGAGARCEHFRRHSRLVQQMRRSVRRSAASVRRVSPRRHCRRPARR